VLGRKPRGGAAVEWDSEDEEMADVQGENATWEARDVVMTETETPSTAASETETEAEALATND